MTLSVLLEPEIEQRFRSEAAHAGLTVEQLAARRMEEAELLWRIHSAAPESETQELHSLLRKQRAGNLNEKNQTKLNSLLDARELRTSQRLEDLTKLSQLSGIPLRQLMDQLGISPIASP